MKTEIYRIIIACFLISILSSCEKESNNDKVVDISGQWEWLYTYKLPPSEPNPLTPQNTGIYEILVFVTDKTWFKLENEIKVDSGIYSLGHGTYTPYPGATVYIYDSVLYHTYGIEDYTWEYYEIFNDTLQFCGGFAGLSGGGSKFYKKLKTLR